MFNKLIKELLKIYCLYEIELYFNDSVTTLKEIVDAAVFMSSFFDLANTNELVMLVIESYLIFDFGGNAISRGLLVKLNSLLNASVIMLDTVFSKMFSISAPNIGDLYKFN